SVYILIGLAWGMGFSFLELLAPGSIYSVKGALVPGDFLYFSFITLMTVGYGDMYPVSPVARSMAMVEAMVGIIFVAVLISRLGVVREQRAGRVHHLRFLAGGLDRHRTPIPPRRGGGPHRARECLPRDRDPVPPTRRPGRSEHGRLPRFAPGDARRVIGVFPD